MNKIILTLVTTLALMFPATVLADGNELLKRCLAAERFIDSGNLDGVNSATSFFIGSCFGLTKGVRNTMQILDDNKVCFPKEGIKNNQGVRIVVSYLKKNPANLHLDDVLLTMLAYTDAYPCK